MSLDILLLHLHSGSLFCCSRTFLLPFARLSRLASLCSGSPSFIFVFRGLVPTGLHVVQAQNSSSSRSWSTSDSIDLGGSFLKAFIFATLRRRPCAASPWLDYDLRISSASFSASPSTSSSSLPTPRTNPRAAGTASSHSGLTVCCHHGGEAMFHRRGYQRDRKQPSWSSAGIKILAKSCLHCRPSNRRSTRIPSTRTNMLYSMMSSSLPISRLNCALTWQKLALVLVGRMRHPLSSNSASSPRNIDRKSVV